MWPFGKSKDKKKKEAQAAKPVDVRQQVLAQMRQVREEIGEEEIQKMAAKLRFEDLKNQFRDDIENNDERRDRMVQELRWQLHEDR